MHLKYNIWLSNILYGGRQGLHILRTFKTSKHGHFLPWLFPIMSISYYQKFLNMGFFILTYI